MARPVLAAALGAALLSGCAVRPTNDTFALSATPEIATASATTTATKKLQILVPTPGAMQALAGQDIVVRLPGSEIRYLSKAQWGDNLPNLVQANLVAGLERTGAFGGVGMPGQGLAIDYQLVVEIRDFSIDAAGGGTANVSLAVKLVDDRSGVVKAQNVFDTKVGVNPTASNGVLVSALDQASAQATSAIVAWAVSTL
ncbi:ABC-type transport auxiliary lipoprotein family protein [Martelella sp. HB161492]|uniref:ABC-type transport auxiliary lipoprotein family protein n=1 Tax=Martelella sp. HB161492 TaxID=2720726 RepID=UPI001FED758B|nr:ABC-type transport auxiliary lipoprotein family protein [Martelella sp. HB161492]